MEISLLNNDSVRIKGKKGSVIINPSGKAFEADGFISLDGFKVERAKVPSDTLIINGPGEYEFGGIKVNGARYSENVIYTLRVDNVLILFANAKAVEKDIAKLSEYNIVVLLFNEIVEPSFIPSITNNIAVMYGVNAQESMIRLDKEGYRTESKFTTSFERLPQELEKVLLQ